MQAAVRTKSFAGYVSGAWQHVMHSNRKNHSLQLIAQTLAHYQLVCLQEADGGSLRSGRIHQAELLAKMAGFEHWADQRNRNVGWRNVMVSSSGNAILSRAPLLRVHDHRLPGRGRGALYAETPQLQVLNVHLSLGSLARTRQLHFLSEVIAEHRQQCSKPLVVAGDFNCEPEFTALQSLCESQGLNIAPTQASFPSWQPRLRLDMVLHCQAVQLRETKVLPKLCSDHLPIAVSLAS